MSVAFSPDGNRIVSASDINTVHVWDAHSGEPVPMAQMSHTAEVWAAMFSPDGRVIASGGVDNIARVWDAQTGLPMKTMEGHGDRIVCLAFSPDSKQIATS